jgi:radical SAM protein with 4Fe4S-binding SPASM domain
MKIQAIVSQLDITEKTKTNIIRKSDFVDHVQHFGDGVPMFSWIDISLTELCNRVCSFCPRADSNVYPNQNLHMSRALLKKIAQELKDLKYEGGVVFCGYGEPLLHPHIMEIVRIFGKEIRTEIVTNGDRLTPKKIKQLFDAGLSYLCVSLYDGPQQVEHFTQMFLDAGISTDRYILRDRWHTEEDSFGLKLTNRGGVISFGPTVDVSRPRPCYYLAYSMALDWNGDALLCVQDWQKKIKFGSVHGQSLESIWRSTRFTSARQKLMMGRREASPCRECNADGTLHGFNHVNEWQLVSDQS